MKKVKILCEVEIDVDKMFDSSNIPNEQIIEKAKDKIRPILQYFPDDSTHWVWEKMKLIDIAIDEGSPHYDKDYIEGLRAKAREDWKDVEDKGGKGIMRFKDDSGEIKDLTISEINAMA